MLVGDHAQELVDAVRYLPLRTSDRYLIASLLSAGEVDFAVVLLLKLIDLRKASNKLAVIKSVHIDVLGRVLRILYNGQKQMARAMIG